MANQRHTGILRGKSQQASEGDGSGSPKTDLGKAEFELEQQKVAKFMTWLTEGTRNGDDVNTATDRDGRFTGIQGENFDSLFTPMPSAGKMPPSDGQR